MAKTASSSTPPARGGFFRGMADVSATAGRSPWISRPGTVLYRVRRISAGVNRVKEPYFHLDVEALHLLAGGTLPEEIRARNAAAERAGADAKVIDASGHQKGEKLAWRVRVHGEWSEIHLANIKNAVEAILTALGEDYSEYDDDQWDTAVFGKDGIAGEDQPAAGLLLVGTTDARVSVKKGEVFTTTTWINGEDVALDLIESGVLTREEVYGKEEPVE